MNPAPSARVRPAPSANRVRPALPAMERRPEARSAVARRTIAQPAITSAIDAPSASVRTASLSETTPAGAAAPDPQLLAPALFAPVRPAPASPGALPAPAEEATSDPRLAAAQPFAAPLFAPSRTAPSLPRHLAAALLRAARTAAASATPLLAAAALASGAPAFAQDMLPPAPFAYRQLPDAEQEKQARALMEQLRCLTCQSQSIADSDAPMAGDMRHQVRTRIAAGESPDQVRAWLVERYGDYVSYRPQMSATTWPLFAVPLLLLVVALLILRRRLRGAR